MNDGMTDDKTTPTVMLTPYSMIEGISWPVIPTPRAAGYLAMQHQLDRSQWQPPSEMQRMQFEQAALLLRHALDTVPYYREKYGAIALPAKLDPVFWRGLPLLERSEAQDQGDRMHSKRCPPSHGNIRMTGSSGSTGRPLKVLGTDTTHFYWLNIGLRDHVWQRRDLSGKLAAIRTKVKTGTSPGWAEWSDSIVTGPSTALNIDASVDEQLDWLVAENPAYLLTHPTNLHALLTRAAERNMRPAGLRELRTFGEMLPTDLRELAKRVWGVGLTDMYSAEETGYIALQCPESENYHIQSENLLVEILNERGAPCAPGETGELVVTTLHNFAMPLIRYRILDHVEVAPPCSCGRSLTAIRRIVGRQRNMLAMPDGSFHWPAFPDWLSVAPVRRFQMVQHDTRTIEVRLACPRDLTAQEEDGIRAMLTEKFGYPFDFRFSYLGNIETGPHGKFEDFVSLVKRAP
jgi:phenylacetate-CoA ligase